MEVAPLPSGISNGTVLAGVLAGRLGSSTRAELAVGLAAMAKPFPVHFASDSRAFCDKANCIISAPDLWPRRPYALQRDGDLWQHFHEGLIARGPNSFRVSWHKAHATLDAIYSGAVRSDHAIHNSVADFAASKGDEVCGRNGLSHLCNFHAAKQRSFIQLMVDINLLLARVMQHDHVLRAARKLSAKLGLVAGSQPAEDAPPPAYACPPLEEGMLIGILQPSVAGLSEEEALLQDQLYLFWKHARVQHAAQGTIGVSWPELFARLHALEANFHAPVQQAASMFL